MNVRNFSRKGEGGADHERLRSWTRLGSIAVEGGGCERCSPVLGSGFGSHIQSLT